MTWKIRHAGSPQHAEGLSTDAVLEGLRDGQWEPTDEVMGPNDTDWVPLESHPQFAEVAAEIEPPPAASHEDETRLDMTPLIDVTMVLLIFIILTTSYAALQRVLDAAQLEPQKRKGLPVITAQQVEQTMVRVVATQTPGGPVFRVENQEVPAERLAAALRQWSGGGKKNRVLIETEGDVREGTVIAIQDAAKGAGFDGAMLLVPDKPKPGP
jgi:biopolymer transport protein ExbD